jgi:DNA-binding SARP family transcriptional activator
VKLSTVYNGRGEIALSAEAAEAGLRLVPEDAPAIRLRLQGNLALTAAWLGHEPLPKAAQTVARLCTEAEALGLEHFAAIGHHNLGAMQRDAGELQQSVENLDKAARFWGALPNSPFADNANLVTTLLAIGRTAEAARMAEAGIASTRSWRRPNAEALGGKAMVLIHQERFDEAEAVLTELLRQPEALGALIDLYRAMSAELMVLVGRPHARIETLVADLADGPRDPRHAIHVDTALALLIHHGGGCRGRCLSRVTSLKEWHSRGAAFAAAVAEVKLSHLAFAHGRGSWKSRAVKSLSFLSSAGALSYVRHWTRRLVPHYVELRGALTSIDLLLALHEVEPATWEAPLVALLPDSSVAERNAILQRLSKHATKRTNSLLRPISGTDAAAARYEIVRKQMPRIFVRTFGPLAIHRGGWDGPRTPVSKRRLRLLVSLMAVNSGSFLPRETVLEALWPDADPGSAVNSLNQSVFQLRRLLDPDPESEGPPYILASSDQVGFNPELVRTDLDEFRRTRSRIERLSHSERRAAAHHLLRLADGEYLADARYEPWAARHLLAVELELREALLPLALGDVLGDSPDISLAAAATLTTLDEFDELAHLAMAKQLARLGKRSKAADVIRQLSRRLATELGANLSAEVRSAAVAAGIPV